MNRSLRKSIIIAGLMAVAAILAAYFSRSMDSPISGDAGSVAKPMGRSTDEKSPSPVQGIVQRISTGASSRLREKVQLALGRDSALEWSDSGFLVSAENLESKAASKDFQLQDTASVQRRASHILNELREALGIRSGFPLGEPKVQVTALNAQAVFEETFQGLAVEPFGTVTVQLGPQGQLLSIYSSYYPSINISNTRLIDAETGRARAIASVSAVAAGVPSVSDGAGRPIIWVTQPGKGEAKHALEYWIQGRQVVVDAGDGKILLNRDRRIF